jgi:hypothetical protein
MKPYLLYAFAVLAFSCQKEIEPPASIEETFPDVKFLTLQPGPIEGNAMFVSHNDSDPKWGTTNVFNDQQANKELAIGSYSVNGAVIKSRAFLSFNLSGLPANAQVLNARLSLYGLPSYHTIPEGNQGSNTCHIQRVTRNWNQATVKWDKQPPTTVQGEVKVPRLRTPYNSNLTDVDVTSLVKDIETNTFYKKADFAIKMRREVPTNTIVFASNRHEDSTKRPKLVISYKD